MRKFALALALAALALSGPAVAQDPGQSVYELEDVVVQPRLLDQATREFVGEVSWPAARRGPARWREGICVGAANFRPEIAQFIVDRVSDRAREIGLRPHTPPCHPFILIVGAEDGQAMANELVAQRPRLFDPGGAGMRPGGGALRAFREGERPVRWWHVSAPIDSDTGELAVRLPGLFVQSPDPTTTVMGYAPQVRSTYASRLATPLEDQLKRSFVIVDADLVGDVTLDQLADYIAFVTLAQVDPEADLSRFDSILNLFAENGEASALSAWDRAYLSGLYEVDPGYVGRGAQTSALERAILAAYRAGESDTETNR
jgi:hypothetical protein